MLIDLNLKAIDVIYNYASTLYGLGAATEVNLTFNSPQAAQNFSQNLSQLIETLQQQWRSEESIQTDVEKAHCNILSHFICTDTHNGLVINLKLHPRIADGGERVDVLLKVLSTYCLLPTNFTVDYPIPQKPSLKLPDNPLSRVDIVLPMQEHHLVKLTLSAFYENELFKRAKNHLETYLGLDANQLFLQRYNNEPSALMLIAQNPKELNALKAALYKWALDHDIDHMHHIEKSPTMATSKSAVCLIKATTGFTTLDLLNNLITAMPIQTHRETATQEL